MQISAVTGIPSYNVEIAKGRGAFPGEVSVLDAHTNGLEWNPSASCLTSWPLYAECGTVIIFRLVNLYLTYLIAIIFR